MIQGDVCMLLGGRILRTGYWQQGRSMTPGPTSGAPSLGWTTPALGLDWLPLTTTFMQSEAATTSRSPPRQWRSTTSSATNGRPSQTWTWGGCGRPMQWWVKRSMSLRAGWWASCTSRWSVSTPLPTTGPRSVRWGRGGVMLEPPHAAAISTCLEDSVGMSVPAQCTEGTTSSSVGQRSTARPRTAGSRCPGGRSVCVRWRTPRRFSRWSGTGRRSGWWGTWTWGDGSSASGRITSSQGPGGRFLWRDPPTVGGTPVVCFTCPTTWSSTYWWRKSNSNPYDQTSLIPEEGIFLSL